MSTISLIVAIDKNNAIGQNNNLLCHLPNDLKYFKSITNGYPIIMGRKTFDSLPKGALPNRRNIVITKNKKLQYENCEMCYSIEEALKLCENEKQMFFIGGSTIYNEALPYADNLYITEIHHSFEEADTFFPQIKSNEWKEVERLENKADEKNKYDHSFIKLKRLR